MIPQLGGGSYDQGYQNAIEDNGGWNTNAEAPGNGVPGMWVNGQLASNLFAFDADGNLLQDVQLFDQDGRPVVTVMDPTKNSTADNVPSYVGDQLLLAPRPTNGGQYAWNVFPLRTLPADAIDQSNGPNGVVDFSKAKPTAPPRKDHRLPAGTTREAGRAS
ncbi:hypothetical protein G7066_13795 [Leucobacter coleopterorum]|uniref:Uncharacterized protein n=1 Tax=Leucobacter coleopterorum TaxID=2714933 RepID=A0ABX6JZP9_9MICO|nr:hypothetical protein [Leucobacter coleopterorum]QIM19381.1 hypothetical protein G7066_13795 [Leucobacter coleopterorum]